MTLVWADTSEPEPGDERTMKKLTIPGMLVALLGMFQATGCCEGDCSGGSDATAGQDDDTETETNTTTLGDCPMVPTGGFSCGEDSDGDDDLTTGLPPSAVCDLWEQSCPEGMKCEPYDGDEDGEPDTTHCVEVTDDGGARGDACFEGGASSASCEVGSICLEHGNGFGFCEEQCVGTMETPSCSGDKVCVALHDGLVPLCATPCDPLSNECPTDTGCYPVEEESLFACLPGGDGAQGDVCVNAQDCMPGHACAAAGSLPAECAGNGCCTAMCEQGSTESQCPPNHVCMPFSGDLVPGEPGFCGVS